MPSAVWMYKMYGVGATCMLVPEKEVVEWTWVGWQVDRRSKPRPSKGTPIPCTPMPRHEVVDAQYINEQVDCGVCGTITLQWRLVQPTPESNSWGA